MRKTNALLFQIVLPNLFYNFLIVHLPFSFIHLRKCSEYSFNKILMFWNYSNLILCAQTFDEWANTQPFIGWNMHDHQLYYLFESFWPVFWCLLKKSRQTLKSFSTNLCGLKSQKSNIFLGNVQIQTLFTVWMHPVQQISQ